MRSTFLLAVATLAPVLISCKSGGIPILNIIPISNPINVLYVTDSPIESATVLLDYEGFRKAMSASLARPVRMEPAFPILAEPGLRGGWQDFAIMSPMHFAQLDNASDFRVAGYANTSGIAARPALFVVKADSSLASLADLKGKQIAFGPNTDARSYHAALYQLKREGVTKADLKKQLVPVPGSLMNLKNDDAIVAAVLNGSADAGVVDAAAFAIDCDVRHAVANAEEKGFRVVGETMILPDRLVVGSPKLKAETLAQAQAFLESASQNYAAELEKAGIKGFSAPDPELDRKMRELRPPNAITDIFQPKPKASDG